MRTGLVWDERCTRHDAGHASSNPWVEPYPALDRPDTRRRQHKLLAASGLLARLVELPAREAGDEELLRFHTPAYLERVAALDETGGDTGESAVIAPGGERIARLAAGGCIAAADAVLEGRVDNAYALVRPCGHHAEADRGRGFCVFANVALAVLHARAVHGVARVAVVDIDVHHGNGTEDAFYADPSVLTISIHQDGYYPPGRGGLDDEGAGAGHGFNLNLPLPPGSGHGAWLAAFERVVLPALGAFAPELIVVACGFDAAASDPLGRMLCHSDTFRALTARLREAAERHCAGRLLVCQEGGYSPIYAPFCTLAVVETLAGLRTGVEDPLLDWYAALPGQSLQAHQEAVVEAARQRLAIAFRAAA